MGRILHVGPKLYKTTNTLDSMAIFGLVYQFSYYWSSV